MNQGHESYFSIRIEFLSGLSAASLSFVTCLFSQFLPMLSSYFLKNNWYNIKTTASKRKVNFNIAFNFVFNANIASPTVPQTFYDGRWSTSPNSQSCF